MKVFVDDDLDPRRTVPAMFCDNCGEPTECLWEFDGQEICEDCLKDLVDHTTMEEWVGGFEE